MLDEKYCTTSRTETSWTEFFTLSSLRIHLVNRSTKFTKIYTWYISSESHESLIFEMPKILKLKRALKSYGYYREGPFDDQNLCFNISQIDPKKGLFLPQKRSN